MFPPQEIKIKVYWTINDGVIQIDFNSMEEEYYETIDNLESDFDGKGF
jgi:hypothetical protein